jgi:hypothetical protein
MDGMGIIMHPVPVAITLNVTLTKAKRRNDEKKIESRAIDSIRNHRGV